MLRENLKCRHTRERVPMRGTLTEHLVLVMKFP